MPAKRHTQVFAISCLLVAVVGGAYAAKRIVFSGAASVPAGQVECPPSAHGWQGRVTGELAPIVAPIREARVAWLVNRFRVAHGRRAVQPTPSLAAAARAHSRDMLRRGYFSHDGPGGAFEQRLARYTPQTCIAENIAWGQAAYGTAAGVVKAWEASPEHRMIMLLPWVRLIGVGVEIGTYRGARGAAVVTADFSY